jgi:prophage antirepressor-like protein
MNDDQNNNGSVNTGPCNLLAPLEVQTFSFNFGDVRADVRVAVRADAVKLFIAKDITDALDYATFQPNLIGSVPAKWKGLNPIKTIRGVLDVWTLTEEGVNFFCFRSDKPRALPFQEWLAGDVLPQIAKTGKYEERQPVAAPVAHAVPQLPDFTDPAESAEAWAAQYRGRVVAEKEVKFLVAKVEEQSEAVNFVQKYVQSNGPVGLRRACQALDIDNEIDFVDFLVNAGRFLYRLDGKLSPKANQRHTGRFLMKTGFNRDNGHAFTQVKITPKGLEWLAGEWAKYNLDRDAYRERHAIKKDDGPVDRAEEAEQAFDLK